jgi:capsular polysaccharide export protein
MLGKNNEQKSYVFNFNKLKKFNFSKKSKIIVWGNYLRDELDDLKKKIQISVYRIEDGFIRSIGLGSNLVKPASLVIDSRGIYYDTSRDNDLKYYFDHFKITPKQIREAKKLQELIINNNISKYNCQPIIKPQWSAKNEKIILIPGQVEDDESIKYGATDIKTNLQLLERVRDLNPNSYIVYKPHPDVLAGNRKGFIEKNKVLKVANYFEDQVSIISCINSCDQVHTITSLAGFEALIRKKKVCLYGNPFYKKLIDLNNQKNKLKNTILVLNFIYITFFKYQNIFQHEAYQKILKNFYLHSSNNDLKLSNYKKMLNFFR